MAYTPPTPPTAPSLSDPANFEVNTSAFLAWFASVAQSGIDGGGFLLTGDILGTVSQSGGVPTGAIIETGVNANGRYTRFADGTQICTFVIPSSSLPAIDTASGSVFRYANEQLWNFPASFVSTDIFVSASCRRAGAFWANARVISKNGIGFYLLSSSSTTSAIVDLFAIGRWY